MNRDERLAYALVIPTLTAIFIGLLFPTAYSFYISFYDVMLTRHTFDFIGLQNYIDIVLNPEIRDAIMRTLVFIGVSVPAEIFLGLVAALVLSQEFKGRRVCRSLLLAPMALIPVVNGISWVWIFNSSYGALNGLLYQIGLIKEYQVWLSVPTSAFACIITADVWSHIPFCAIVLLAALEVIPRDQYESAKVDGAGPVATFRHITLPNLTQAFLVLFTLRSLWAFQVFDVVYSMTGGGPGQSTLMLTIYTWLRTFRYLSLGYGSALAYLTTAIVIVFSLVYMRLLLKRGQE